MSEALRFDDPQWCEAEYNPRVRVSDFATYPPKWSDGLSARVSVIRLLPISVMGRIHEK